MVRTNDLLPFASSSSSLLPSPTTTLLTTTLLTSTLPTATASPTPVAPPTHQYSSSTTTNLSCTDSCKIALPTILISLLLLLTTLLCVYQHRQKKLARKAATPSILPGQYRYPANTNLHSANSSATTLAVMQPGRVGAVEGGQAVQTTPSRATAPAQREQERESEMQPTAPRAPSPARPPTPPSPLSPHASARASVTSAFIYSKHTSYDGPAGSALAPPAAPTTGQRISASLKRPLSLFSLGGRREGSEEEGAVPGVPMREVGGGGGEGEGREGVRESQIGVGR